jgi:hypothetical protein
METLLTSLTAYAVPDDDTTSIRTTPRWRSRPSRWCLTWGMGSNKCRCSMTRSLPDDEGSLLSNCSLPPCCWRWRHTKRDEERAQERLARDQEWRCLWRQTMQQEVVLLTWSSSWSFPSPNQHLHLGLINGLDPRPFHNFIWPFYKTKSKSNKISIQS